MLNCQDQAFSTSNESVPNKALCQRGEAVHCGQGAPTFLNGNSCCYYGLFHSLMFLGEASRNGQRYLSRTGHESDFQRITRVYICVRPHFLIYALVPREVLRRDYFDSTFLQWSRPSGLCHTVGRKDSRLFPIQAVFDSLL